MLDEVFSPLLENTYTTNELYNRLGIMKEYYDMRAYSADEKEKNMTLQVFLEQKKADTDPDTIAALSVWENYFSAHTSGAMESATMLQELHEKIHALPSVVLYLPLVTEGKDVAGIAMWFRTNVRKNILLEVKVDANVTGGCALIWNGMYYDFSLRYYMQKKRKELVSMLNEYGSHP